MKRQTQIKQLARNRSELVPFLIADHWPLPDNSVFKKVATDNQPLIQIDHKITLDGITLCFLTRDARQKTWSLPQVSHLFQQSLPSVEHGVDSETKGVGGSWRDPVWSTWHLLIWNWHRPAVAETQWPLEVALSLRRMMMMAHQERRTKSSGATFGSVRVRN